MIFPRFRRPSRPDTISALYGMIVAQARLPSFYRDYAVPDTVNGRFELILLHLFLLLERLTGDESMRGVGQGVFDEFCRDMDDNLREMGVGDLAVPKQMRRVGEAFYGHARAYREAFSSSDERALAATLARNIYEDAAAPQAARLAAYARVALARLKGLDSAALMAGDLGLPDPAAIH